PSSRAEANSIQRQALELISSGAPPPRGNGLRIHDSVWLVSGGPRSTLLPPPPGDDGSILAYSSVFYPRSDSIGQAMAFELTPGQQRPGVDIQLLPSPTVSVAGV